MVYILLGAGFEESEALVTADVLRRAEIPVALTGIGGRAVTGSHDITVRTDRLVEEVVLGPGDMVVLPGGLGGVSSIEHSQAAMRLVRQAADDTGMWVAAICAAPTLLARARLLPAGLPWVCYPGMEKELSEVSVSPEMHRSTVTQGNYITGRGPGSAFDFGLALVEALKDAATARRVRAQLVYQL